jgi:uncharacterized protein with FMN-binding domain
MRRALAALIVTAVVVVLLASYETTPPMTREREAAVKTPRAPARRVSGGGPRSALGPAMTTPFSAIQVRAFVTGRKLTGIETVLLSGDGPHTEALNARAEPILRREALRAGSADVDVVSGATYTSESWKRSLQAAIDRARG